MGVIRLTGEDRVKYLHSQVTCDVQALQAGQHTLAGHCDPKGKLWNLFRLVVEPTSLLMLSPRELFAKALPELKKYAVFSKVGIEDASDELPLFGVAGQGADAWIQAQGLHAAAVDGAPYAIQLAPDRWLLLGHPAAVDTLPAEPELDWWGQEILAGHPTMSALHQGEYIPQMLNLQALNGISFRKGCYTGQETVARAKYRGANNRRLFILQGHVSATLTPGDTLEWQLGEHWKRVGIVLDCWQQQQQVLLSAVLPQDLDADACLRIKGDEGSHLHGLPLPYALSDE